MRDELLSRRFESHWLPFTAGASGIDTLILLDRTLDLATPMATQLTYEGLLDEVFGLSCGQVRMEAEGKFSVVAGTARHGAFSRVVEPLGWGLSLLNGAWL